MKLVDSIHLAAKDPKAAKDIASSYYLAIVVDAGILVALIFGAVWLLDSVATVIPGGSDIASKVLVIFLFTMVIGGGIFTLIRTVLHAIPICINTANQIRGIVPEDVNNNVDSPNNDTGGTEEEVAAEETLISLFTNRVKDKDGLEKVVKMLLEEQEESSGIVLVFYALVKLDAIKNNQAAFQRACSKYYSPFGKSEFSELKRSISKAVARKYEDRTDRDDLYKEKFDKFKAELSQYCK